MFTPSSFALAMLKLSALNVIDFTVVRSFPSEGCEFYVTLRRGRIDHNDTDALQARRLKLHRRTLKELREQAEMLDESNGFLACLGSARSQVENVSAAAIRQPFYEELRGDGLESDRSSVRPLCLPEHTYATSTSSGSMSSDAGTPRSIRPRS